MRVQNINSDYTSKKVANPARQKPSFGLHMQYLADNIFAHVDAGKVLGYEILIKGRDNRPKVLLLSSHPHKKGRLKSVLISEGFEQSDNNKINHALPNKKSIRDYFNDCLVAMRESKAKLKNATLGKSQCSVSLAS